MNLSSIISFGKNIWKFGKSFLPNPWIILLVISLIAISSGISAKIAYDFAYSTQQTSIDKIVNKQTQERADWNKKLAKISITSFDEMQSKLALQLSRNEVRESIITKWKTHVLTVEKKCGLSKSAVGALNEMIEVSK